MKTITKTMDSPTSTHFIRWAKLIKKFVFFCFFLFFFFLIWWFIKQLRRCRCGKGSLGPCLERWIWISSSGLSSKLSLKKQRDSISSLWPRLSLSVLPCTLHYRMECLLCTWRCLCYRQGAFCKGHKPPRNGAAGVLLPQSSIYYQISEKKKRRDFWGCFSGEREYWNREASRRRKGGGGGDLGFPRIQQVLLERQGRRPLLWNRAGFLWLWRSPWLTDVGLGF